jgi:hypothetical protein
MTRPDGKRTERATATYAKKRFLPDVGSARSVTDFAETFPKIVALVAHGTRCGKPNCRCTRGMLHPTHYLRWREGPTQRRRYVRHCEVPAVRAILERRREHRRRERLAHALSLRSWRELARLVEDVGARMREERERS